MARTETYADLRARVEAYDHEGDPEGFLSLACDTLERLADEAEEEGLPYGRLTCGPEAIAAPPADARVSEALIRSRWYLREVERRFPGLANSGTGPLAGFAARVRAARARIFATRP